jgi:hypothetical protein
MSGRVPFSIWDAALELPPATGYPVTVMAAGQTLLAIGLRRGTDLLTGPAITVHSFAPHSQMSEVGAMAGHALIDFTKALPGRTEDDVRSNMQHLIALSRTEPEPTRLTIAGNNIAAGLYRLYDHPDRWVVCSRDPDLPVAVAGSYASVPVIEYADERTWTVPVNEAMDRLDLP